MMNLCHRIVTIPKKLLCPSVLYVCKIRQNQRALVEENIPTEVLDDVPISAITRILANRANGNLFSFNIKADSILNQPFLRFDVAGPSHHNRFPNIPLSEQKIDTPHFHKINNSYQIIAYRTNKLQDKIDKGLIFDINTAFDCFCDEANICAPIPYIFLGEEGQIFPPITEENPLENVIFA